jgi:hypothetical protein
MYNQDCAKLYSLLIIIGLSWESNQGTPSSEFFPAVPVTIHTQYIER